MFTVAEYYDSFRIDWDDADRAYHNYVENCRRMGLEPMSWELAKTQMTQWLEVLAAGLPQPPNTH